MRLKEPNGLTLQIQQASNQMHETLLAFTAVFIGRSFVVPKVAHAL